MRRILILPLLLVLLTSALAQNRKPTRVDGILYFARQRVSDQNDLWFHDGDFPRIVQSLRFLFELFPFDGESATNLGWMLENVDEYPKALKVYETYRQRNLNDIDSVLPVVQYYYMRRKDPAKVISYLEPAIRDPRIHPNAYRMLARTYENLGKLKDAERVLRLFLTRHPDEPQAKANLKRILDKIAKGSKGK